MAKKTTGKKVARKKRPAKKKKATEADLPIEAINLVAEYYPMLIKQKQMGKLTRREDRIIWAAVSARCTKDMSGFEEVFEQVLEEEDDILALIEGLEELGATDLASAFRSAHELLGRYSFFTDAYRYCDELPEEAQQQLSELGARVGDDLWDLDDRLAKLIPADWG